MNAKSASSNKVQFGDELSLNSINARRMVRQMRKIIRVIKETKRIKLNNRTENQVIMVSLNECVCVCVTLVELQFNRHQSECDHSALHTEQRGTWNVKTRRR